MSKNKENKTWPELGTLRKNKNGKVFIVLNPGVKVSLGKYNKETKGYDSYQEIDLGEYRTVACTDPGAGLEALLEGNFITEEQYQDRVDFIKNKNIRYKLVVPPNEE